MEEDRYDQGTNTWVIDRDESTATTLQLRVIAMQKRMERYGYTVPVADGPYWIAPRAMTRRVRTAKVLHCYHCPSLHNSEIEWIDLTSKDRQLSEYVFCKLCKKFEGLEPKQQNVIHEGMDGDKQPYVEEEEEEIEDNSIAEMTLALHLSLMNLDFRKPKIVNVSIRPPTIAFILGVMCRFPRP